MDKLAKIRHIRKKLNEGSASIGTWQQIGSSEISEIVSSMGFDWVAIDLEHGSISNSELPDIFRALELNETLPFARVKDKSIRSIKDVMEAGCSGIIFPMVDSGKELRELIRESRWPPSGKRGVGFCRANLYGREFNSYIEEAQSPIIVAMIETAKGIENIEEITSAKSLDAIIIGPYDLSSSLGCCADFQSDIFLNALEEVKNHSKSNNIPFGIHIIEPDKNNLNKAIIDGYQFIAYSLDTSILCKGYEGLEKIMNKP